MVQCPKNKSINQSNEHNNVQVNQLFVGVSPNLQLWNKKQWYLKSLNLAFPLYSYSKFSLQKQWNCVSFLIPILVSWIIIIFFPFRQNHFKIFQNFDWSSQHMASFGNVFDRNDLQHIDMSSAFYNMIIHLALKRSCLWYCFEEGSTQSGSPILFLAAQTNRCLLLILADGFRILSLSCLYYSPFSFIDCVTTILYMHHIV